MERLVKEASKMEAGIAAGVKAGDMSFGNIVKAIHAVQENMGIANATYEESEGTITGSLASVKAAWQNLMPALVNGGDEFDKCIENFVKSAKTFGENMLPTIEKALEGTGKLIEELAPIIEAELPELVDTLLPPLIKAATSLLTGLIKALPSIVKAIAKEIPNIVKELGGGIVEAFGSQFPIIGKIGEFFTQNANSIATAIKKIIPVVIALVAAFKGFKMVKGITSFFGGLSKGGKGGKGGGLLDTFKSLAKAKPTTILKGMANLAIIVGGFTILAAALMLVAPYMAKLSDGKSLLEVMSVMVALGIAGGVMVKFANIAGSIPIMTVVKGLANMAIMIVGLTALTAAFMLVAPYVAKLADAKTIFKVIGIMVALGAVGAILTVFAGIAGMIPIPVVLAGLANIALVLGGMTALIVAFGALSKIEGFGEFIASGGKIIAKIFGVIGECVGSIIGGIAEGITNSLPKIGENLAKFAEALKPMFSMFKGVDMGGVGSFFSAIGSFILKMTGNKILEFFTGKTDFSGVAEGLKSLTTEGVKKFFAMVAGFEAIAFSNAKLFFECLDGISALPNTGGIGQLFTGKNDFEGVSTGLGKLASQGVKNFFAMVQGFEAVAFDNAKKFFECLDGIHSLPNSGGLGQLFSGKNDFEGVASGLDALSGEGVKKFFAMVTGLDTTVFAKTKELFAVLADIGNVGEEGFWERVGKNITGDSGESGITKIAAQLSTFATNTESFFTQINSLDLTKLNGLWKSLEKAGKLTTDNLSTVIDESISTLVEKISGLPKKMGDALKQNSKSLSSGFVEMWKAAIKASVAPVNKLLSGANHILKEFGSKKQLISWKPYAKGTNGHKGGNALVNDGRGAELVQMPNGNTFIPRGKNVFLPNAPKGMKVLSAENTARLFGRKSATFNYANGTGSLDVWSYIDNASGLVNKVSESIKYDGMSGFALNAGKAMVSMFKGEMSAWVEKLFEENGALGLSDYVASKGVAQWRSTVIRALKMEGQYSAANVARTLYQMQTESGGNPRAINLWDSNAKRGIPSKGLMQVIDPTFQAYARQGFNKNIYDPLSNILASVRYATSRYGSLAKAYQGKGYSKGVGTISMPQQPSAVNLSYTPESDSNTKYINSIEYNTYSPHFEINISGTNDDRTMARKVKRWIAEAWEDMLDDLDSKNPQTVEI